MNDTPKPLLLSVDDDSEFLSVVEGILTGEGYRVMTAADPIEGLDLALRTHPDLILLDLRMPTMDGYEFCRRLQGRDDGAPSSGSPGPPGPLVMFLTAYGDEQDRARAFAVGAVDFLQKPITKAVLLEKVRSGLAIQDSWRRLPPERGTEAFSSKSFLDFKAYLKKSLTLSPDQGLLFEHQTPAQLYSQAAFVGLTSTQIAKAVAAFLHLTYRPLVDPEAVQLGVLPAPFSLRNHVVAVKEEASRGRAFLLSNPFNLELIDILERTQAPGQPLTLLIAEPEKILRLFDTGPEPGTPSSQEPVVWGEDKDKIQKLDKLQVTKLSDAEAEQHPVQHIANNILCAAVDEHASDIHFEPKEDVTVVRFRVDGDMREVFQLRRRTGEMLLSRLKVMGGLDIAERRRPQDGSLEVVINKRTFKLRLATTSTPDGESLIIRLLEPGVKPKMLSELGMASDQAKLMAEFALRTHGLILIVGPTGSGKTTTIYSFLSQIDTRTRSLLSVEDPVEYRISYANQQQVNEKAGVTFETLLKSAMRQDPDILFLGEIRDPHSARTALDFASTGHLTISTLHTSNATTAIFRLERLGIPRGMIADCVLGIVAQRLVKRLCPECKGIAPITPEEREMLGSIPRVPLAQIAHPVGCPRCHQTGYLGREGVYEIMTFDPEIAEKIRAELPIAEIRKFCLKRGDYLISHHAVDKVRNLIFDPRDVYGRVLAEELTFLSEAPEAPQPAAALPQAIPEPSQPAAATALPLVVLVVDDDQDTRVLLERILQKQGCQVTLAADGLDALMAMARTDFDLILSDIEMPNLDGLRLLEIKNQKGLRAPVMFLTGRDEESIEVRALELGAAEFIRKPIKGEVLWMRIKRLMRLS